MLFDNNHYTSPISHPISPDNSNSFYKNHQVYQYSFHIGLIKMLIRKIELIKILIPKAGIVFFYKNNKETAKSILLSCWFNFYRQYGPGSILNGKRSIRNQKKIFGRVDSSRPYRFPTLVLRIFLYYMEILQ
ncbi:hypothetical protein BpHYR1_008662 [Brachionus plicatilis]|uniref:Uncharacterized protein n=1 Tax=Brachionus plicatilis TaxID=10195 RepID=A0A3M7T9Z0_BRAPC|nr:hypothetical protein BpHYR1_008662 [Brachionus plicatilis]